MAWPGFELAPSESPIMESTLTSATQPLNSRLFYSKVRFISPFYCQTLLFPKICTSEFMLHRDKPTMNWFSPRRTMWPIQCWNQRLVLASHILRFEPASELNGFEIPCKLVFLKCMFEFMVNTAPPTSNSVYGREKCFKCNNFSIHHSFCIWTWSNVAWQAHAKCTLTSQLDDVNCGHPRNL